MYFKIDELAQTIIDQYGNDKLKAVLQPERPGDIKDSYADISLAKKVLGYKPKVDLKDGLQEIIDSKRTC